MAKNREEQAETSILPLKYVDFVEDLFHAILAVALLVIGIGAFFYSIKRSKVLMTFSLSSSSLRSFEL